MVRKSSWIQSLFAWLLPACVGTAVGGGMIVALSQPDIKPEAKLALLTPQPPRSFPASVVAPSPPALEPQKTGRELNPQPVLEPLPETDPKPAPKNISKFISQAVPSPQPWEWRPLVDDVGDLFRTEILDIGGLPLLYYATLLDDAEWIGQLISHGASANEPTAGGDTALCAAVRHMGGASVRALVYGGADPVQPGFEKQPPIALASLRRGPDILRALTAAGADPNTRFAAPVSQAVLDRVLIKDLLHSLENDRGVTPLIACAARGDVEGATALLRAGAKTDYCTTRYKRYPINFAATQGYLFLMRIILGRQPESEPQILVTVNLTKQRAWVTHEGQIVDSCAVSTGREGYSTPAGRYVITDKHRDWTSTLYHVSMPFFMRLNCSAIGLHSGYVTGRPASHGCIRLPYEKAKKFFSLVRVGDEVQIVY